MEKSDINLEFAHVEFNTQFDKRQVLASAMIAQRLLTDFTKRGLICSVCVLIDDKHAGRKLTNSDIAPFLSYISEHVSRIDYICYESKLTEYKEEMFDCLMPDYKQKVRHKVLNYEEKNGRIACSHDIAIWHLMRLGYILGDATTLLPVGAVRHHFSFPPFHAKRVVSVLSKTDSDPERSAESDILKFCYDKSILHQIERIYFDPLTGKVVLN